MAKRFVWRLVVAAALLASCAAIASCAPSANASSEESELLPQALEDRGIATSVAEWLESLDDEQRAALDIAFEQAEAEGYQGDEASWAAREVRARLGSNGDVIVMLPDGGEFSVPAHSGSANGDGGSASQPANAAQGNTGGGSAATPPASAQGASNGNHEAPLISVESVNAHSGDDISLSVRIERNPGVMGLTLSVSYDESALALSSAENGDVFNGVLTMTRSREYASGCLFTWDGVEVAPEDARDGAILTLNFHVADDAAAGIYPVAARIGSAFDSDLREITLAAEDGNVVVG